MQRGENKWFEEKGKKKRGVSSEDTQSHAVLNKGPFSWGGKKKGNLRGEGRGQEKEESLKKRKKTKPYVKNRRAERESN